MAQTIKERLKELAIDDLYGIKPEIKALGGMVKDPNDIRAVSSGAMEGKRWVFAVLSDRFIALHAHVVTGGGCRTVSLDSVKALSYKKGLLFGSVELEVDGQTWSIKNVHKRTIMPFFKALS